MKVLESKPVMGLCVLSSVDGKRFLKVSRKDGPSVVQVLGEATPIPERLATKLVNGEFGPSVFYSYPEVEHFLERAVIRKIEAQALLIEMDKSDFEPEITEEDLGPNRVLH